MVKIYTRLVSLFGTPDEICICSFSKKQAFFCKIQPQLGNQEHIPISFKKMWKPNDPFFCRHSFYQKIIQLWCFELDYFISSCVLIINSNPIILLQWNEIYSKENPWRDQTRAWNKASEKAIIILLVLAIQSLEFQIQKLFDSPLPSLRREPQLLAASQHNLYKLKGIPTR
jgi:hypothetical protein